MSQISSWSHVLNFRKYFSPFELELKAQTIQLCNDLQSSLFLKLLRLTAKSFLEAFRAYSPLSGNLITSKANIQHLKVKTNFENGLGKTCFERILALKTKQ